MRNFKFLRKSERKSVGTTLALTVGSPSAHRRYSALKHLTFMLLFLLGSLNVWGADDVLNQTWTGKSGTNYSALDKDAPTSDAHYKGNCAGDKSSIQLRSNNNNSGIVSTVSGGKAKKIVVSWHNDTSNGRTLNVYGKNSAYTDATDLYNSSTQGTLLGTIVKGTSTELNITDDHEYIGFRSASGAMYLTSVTITWEESGSSDPTVSVTPESWDFGNVAKSTAASKEFTIAGSNLTGNLTFSVTGGYTLSANGATVSEGSVNTTLTVSKHTNTIGANNGTLTISGGGLDPSKTVDLTMTVVDDPKPTGTFSLYNGAIKEGDYVLVGYSTSAQKYYAMNNTVTDNQYLGITETSISNNQIENPNESLVWTIAESSNGYYIKNGNEYLDDNATSNKNYAHLVAEPATTSEWNFAYNDTWTITNYGTTTTKKTLSFNIGNNRVACYTGIQSGNTCFYLYKKLVESAVTITNPEHGTVVVTKGGNPVTTGTNVAEQSTLNVSIEPVVGYNFTLKAYKTGTPTTVVPIDANGNLTMPDYPITITADETALLAVNIAVNDANMGSTTIDGGTVTVYKNNGGTAALVAVAEAGHEFVNWTAPDGITFDNATALSATATIGIGGTITANFKAQSCFNLVAPTLNSVTKSYETATIAWNTVENAYSYAVSVVNHTTSESVFSGVVTELSKELTDLAANTQYDYTIMAKGDGSTYCDDNNPTLAGSFTTEQYPAATLTLSDAEGTSTFPDDHKLKDVIQLPSTAASCSKTFVGWDVDGDCDHAPTYAPGAYYKLNATTQTLYAVYADGGATEETATVSIETYATANSWTDATKYTSIALDENITATADGGGNTGKYYTTGNEWRFYQNESATITIATTVGVLSSIKFTYGVKNTGILEDADDNVVVSATAVSASGTSAVYHVANSSTATNGQVKFTGIEVKYLKPGSYSNYSTTCAAAPTAEAKATDVAALVNVDAAGTNGTVAMTYTNVNPEGVVVALFNDEDCTEPFDGGWLEAEIAGDDKHIEYTVNASTSYKNARTAYIKLTAPAEVAGPAPAVVVIPVSQVKKAAVFTSLEELAAADVAANTNVTVTLTDVLIKEIYIFNNNRRGLVFNVQKDNEDVKIYFNADVPAAWVAGGKVSGTLTDCPWKIYSGAWQLAPANTWAWDQLTYTAPPAIKSIEIRGNATHKTYIDGQAFNPAGLEVIAIYDDNVTEEDVTSYATWTYNPAKLGQSDTEVTVTATYNEKSDDETVTGLTVNPIPNKTIAEFINAGGTRCYLEGIVGTIENTTYGNFYLTDANNSTIYVFGCLTPEGESKKFADLEVEQGDQIKVIAEAYTSHATKGSEAVNVVFVSKVSAATITIDDINMTVGGELLLTDIVATVTPDAAQSATINYEVTEGNAVTISEGKIIASSTEGEATITASIAAGEGYLAGSTTFTVTVSPAPVPFEGDYFVKVANNSDLTAGEYLIVYEDGSLAFNGGLETLDATSNYVAVTFENGKIQGKAEVLAATFTVKLAGTIQSKSGYYIGRTGNSNGMNTSAEDAYTNAISIDDGGNAVILASGGAYMRFNSTSGQERFRYFQSSSYTNQKAIQLYKKENAEPVYETVRTELEPNAYYTMCLDKAVTAVRGGSIWRVLSKAQNTSDIILEEVDGTLDAGRPYIFFATADKLEVVYEGAAVLAPVTDGNNGLVGSFTQVKIANDPKYYIIYNNALYYVNSDKVYVGAHRAYLDMTRVPAYSNEPQQGNAPRRRVTMAVYGEQVATGIESIQPSEISNQKVLINGQLFILRGEKMYDAKGQLVK